MITKEQLAALTVDVPPKMISVPILGEVFVRLVSEEETIIAGKIQGAPSRAKYISYCLCDEDGKRIYGDKDLGEIRELKFVTAWSIFEQGMKYNGMMPENEDEDDDDGEDKGKKAEKN